MLGKCHHHSKCYDIIFTIFSLSDPHDHLDIDIPICTSTIGIIETNEYKQKINTCIAKSLMDWNTVDIPVENIIGGYNGIGRGKYFLSNISVFVFE